VDRTATIPFATDGFHRASLGGVCAKPCKLRVAENWMCSMHARYRLEQFSTCRRPIMAFADLSGFSQAFEREIDRARTLRYPLCALCVELGPNAGDALVARVENVLSAIARVTDVATQSSEQEFVVLLPETNTEGAESLARRIDAALREALWIPEASPVHVGIAAWTPEMNALSLLHAARAASTHARQIGTNAVHIAHGACATREHRSL
jgi:diguanylate cyclase (GGDEF)-like protein